MTSSRFFILAIGICGALLVLQESLRAARESITVDEAYAYELFIRGGLPTAFSNYSAGHHVLQTILSLGSISIFGLSEFALRLPSLVGLCLYLTSIGALIIRYFQGNATNVILIAFLALNPLFLDHFALARGYGLGLAFFSLAFFLAVKMLWERSTTELGPIVAACLALSAGSNLVFLFPASALVAIVGLVLIKLGTPLTWALLQRRILGPWLVTTFCIVVIPLSHAEKNSFYFGSAGIEQMVRSLLLLSFYHSDCAPAGYPVCDSFVTNSWPLVLLGVIHLFAVYVAYRLWTCSNSWSAQDLFSFVALGVHGLNLAALLAGHALNMPYPWGRTGIPILFTFSLCILAIVVQSPSLTGRTIGSLRIATLVLAAAAAVRYAGELGFGPYPEWRFDAGTKEIFNRTAMLASGRPEKLAVLTNQPLSNALGFYEGSTRADIEIVPATELAKAEFAAYDIGQRTSLSDLGFEEIYWNELSATGLAARPR